MSGIFPNSLSFRLMAITTVWTVVALLTTGIILSTLFRKNAERDFRSLLLAHTSNIMAAVDVDSDDKVSGSPNLGDPNFNKPLSGWYWAVFDSRNLTQPILRSASVLGEPLVVLSAAESPFDKVNYQRTNVVVDAAGQKILQLEAQLEFENTTTVYQVLVAGTTAGLDAAVYGFVKTLTLFFILFGLGTILVTYVAIGFGLKPLTNATEELQEIRDGSSETLIRDYPIEIRPLVNEINALIEANGSIVDRARTQVGNLAHALKTPLAVMLNEVRKPTKTTPKLMSEQAQLMKSQVQTYLDRARIAAQRNVISSRTNVAPVVEKLVRVMAKLSPNIDFDFVEETTGVVFRGEEQDLEEVLGNLLENASRFATREVRIVLSTVDNQREQNSRLKIEISDDGPGLTIEEQAAALKRGIRLDESKPGSGLGLSIVRDIATEYGGIFELGQSSLGGLNTTIILPKVANKQS